MFAQEVSNRQGFSIIIIKSIPLTTSNKYSKGGVGGKIAHIQLPGYVLSVPVVVTMKDGTFSRVNMG